ncbi:MAG: gliding motility-associated C-terminal domain-containing protein [Bacteroidetes bacterium]|nr:gliding motility-associated C-terminal domain-containing protein [Bacteroidota bacterium]
MLLTTDFIASIHGYNRNGRKVFEIRGYDIAEKAFTGEANVNGFGNLPSGMYYYWIDRNDGTTAESGFFVLNR